MLAAGRVDPLPAQAWSPQVQPAPYRSAETSWASPSGRVSWNALIPANSARIGRTLYRVPLIEGVSPHVPPGAVALGLTALVLVVVVVAIVSPSIARV